MNFVADENIDRQIVDGHAFVQAYALAPGANAVQLIVSNGIDCTFGNP
ncbi:MAG: hypothetical protein MUC36_13085 [Planctomycetes bacterium]|nr:hypothetical protein [Planctomycetota bacterium]